MRCNVPHRPEVLEKLRQLCVLWGGDLLSVSQKEYYKIKPERLVFSESPFSSYPLACNWALKRIIYVERAVWGEVIHEMMHTFVGLQPPNESGDEWDHWGWEYAVAKHIKASIKEWRESNAAYQVSTDVAGFEPCPYSDLSARLQIALIRRKQREAVKAGIVLPDGTPIARR